MRERNQIRVVVRAFADDCAGCWPVTKTHDDVIRNHPRNAGQRNRAHTPIEQIAGTELVQQIGTEAVNEADLKVGPFEGEWIGETAKGVSGVFVPGSGPIELTYLRVTEETVVLAKVVVQSQRGIMAVEKIPIGLELVRADDALQEIAIPVESARQRRGIR